MSRPMELTEAVCEIAKRAGERMKHRPQDVMQKGNASDYVTETDIRIQQILSEELTNLLPGSQVCGEEGIHTRYTSRDIWIVDPIDGTSNFIRDLGTSCVSIALKRDGVLFSGVVYNPFREELFYAEQGCGAYRNGEPIHVSDRDFAHSLFCSAMSTYDKRYAEPCFEIIHDVFMECDDLRRFGTAALEGAQLAAGRVELYFEMRLCPWDSAAAAILIEEAGGYWECLYQEGLPHEKRFAFLAANTRENFDHLREIVVHAVPSIPYEEALN